MRFKVAGAFDYHLAVAQSADVPALLVDEGARVIQLSPTVPAPNRLQLALEGLAHAFSNHVGFPAGEVELRAQLATFAKSTMTWLSINGGEAALMRLGSGEAPREFAGRQNLPQSRCCAVCQQSVAPGSVEWMIDPSAPGRALVSLYCEGCGHLQSWRESVGVNGLPNAEDVSAPTFGKGAKLRAFIRRHPECGVVVVED